MSFCTGRACLRQSRDGHPARRSQKVPIWSGRTWHPSGLAQGSALRLDSRHRPALSRRVRPDKWQKSNDPEWQVLWSRASAAGASGRLLPALRLFSAAIAAHPTAGEPYEGSRHAQCQLQPRPRRRRLVRKMEDDKAARSGNCAGDAGAFLRFSASAICVCVKAA
jgi:hypothetical protein